ncbi:uncharacterized protein LOC141622612 [Silene latifolia]|uniref:uncharacterized protein LOC141622612 n=1 Tax=Silene latifolia TaxID=37657 RepID=UPI003D77087E
MSSFLGKHPLNTHLSLPNVPKPKPWRNSVISASLPARDRVIDFGKYKGRMLGTLPSTYLKWVSNNLRARDFEEWAHLADQVLQDPVYNDRVEWEYADKLLNGNVSGLNSVSVRVRPVDELLELSQRFGWDNEDKAGWGRVDFQMLGTSKGGRIPRIKEGSTRPAEGRDSGKKNDAKLSVEETRNERRERLRMRRSVRNVDDEEEGRKGGAGSRAGGEVEVPGVYNPFPGRETLLKKVLNRRKIG